MKIVDRDRTPEPAPAAPSAAGAKRARLAAGAPEAPRRDEAAVSAFAARLSDRQAAIGAEERARLERLRSAYQTGAYTVDTASVSRAIVNSCLGFGSV